MPASSNATVRTGSSERSGRVVTFVILELGKTVPGESLAGVTIGAEGAVFAGEGESEGPGWSKPGRGGQPGGLYPSPCAGLGRPSFAKPSRRCARGVGVVCEDGLTPEIPSQPSSDGNSFRAFFEDAPRLAPKPSRGPLCVRDGFGQRRSEARHPLATRPRGG
jgi:hypothetical protein